MFFSQFNRLPGEISAQNPFILLRMLDGLGDESEPVPCGMEWFYGE